jgi:hypothetical protein
MILENCEAQAEQFFLLCNGERIFYLPLRLTPARVGEANKYLWRIMRVVRGAGGGEGLTERCKKREVFFFS